MSNRAIAGVLRVVRSAAHPTDRELLSRFADGDESAFAALVRRHSAMVFGVCRRALPTVQDAEDACQATFLILARKAKGGHWQPSIANWLYTTARRTASKANRAAARRAKREARATPATAESVLDQMTGREAFAALDEELDRLPAIYRAPLVLCYLQGLTREDAARSLGVPPATVKSQLDRGRKKLGEALEKRGIVLGAGLLALAVTSPAGASPPRLVELILAAAGGSPSPAAAALAQGVAVNTWIKGVALPLVALAGLALVAVGSARPGAADKPAEAKKDAPAAPAAASETAVVVTGTVVGPDGKPVEGAAINTLGGTEDKLVAKELARTDKVGRFTAKLDPLPPGRPDFRSLVAVKAGHAPDWARVAEAGDRPVALKLAPDDVPVAGRVTDLQGKPVPGAKVRVGRISTTPGGDLSRVWEGWASSPEQALRHAGKELYSPAVAGFPESVTADKDGRFELRGVGRGRLLSLTFEADGIETAACRVVVDPAFDPKAVRRGSGSKRMGYVQVGPELYGARFTHAAKPSQPIVGTVVDGTTGKPVAGVQVNGRVSNDWWWENSASTKADDQGRFRLLGVAKAKGVALTVFPAEGQPYFPYSTTVPGQAGLAEIPATLKLVRGVAVSGRVVEKQTGKPVAGAGIRYTALADNKFYARRMAGKESLFGMGYSTDADGRFKLVVLPGAGILLAQGETRGRHTGTEYTQVRIAKEDMGRADLGQLDNLGEMFHAADGMHITLNSLSAYKIISPGETDESAQVELTFDRGRSVSGAVVGPDGQPASGVKAHMLTACYDEAQTLADGKFTAIALEPDHPRKVLFVDEARRLSAELILRGDEKDPVAKLRPWGSLTGRLIDVHGKPLAGAKVTPYVGGVTKNMAFIMAAHALSATTDKDGKFALGAPAGDVPYHLSFSVRGSYLNTVGRERPKYTVKPGEATAVGDVGVKE